MTTFRPRPIVPCSSRIITLNTRIALTSLPFKRLLPTPVNVIIPHTRPNRYILVIVDRVLETQVDGELEHGVARGLDVDLFRNLDENVSLPLRSIYEICDREGDVVLVILGVCSKDDVSLGFVEVSECHDGGQGCRMLLGLRDKSRVKFKI